MPSVVGQALELIELAGEDPEVLAELAPEHLAGLTDQEPAAYLRALLEELPEELLARALEDPA